MHAEVEKRESATLIGMEFPEKPVESLEGCGCQVGTISEKNGRDFKRKGP